MAEAQEPIFQIGSQLETKKGGVITAVKMSRAYVHFDNKSKCSLKQVENLLQQRGLLKGDDNDN